MIELTGRECFGYWEQIKDELIEIGEELMARRVIRHYEVECFPGVNNIGQEVHAVFYNRGHDRSVSLWVTEFFGSNRRDGIGCKAQLWGKPVQSRPDAHHSVRLSKQVAIPLSGEAISSTICDLILEKTPVMVV
ncbi:hypothetical protein [Marinobacter sp.]|uniref:hypothetical protein n=1 Tax=Marinobacter sp. TaxID=50741 RepID=UPI003566165B